MTFSPPNDPSPPAVTTRPPALQSIPPRQGTQLSGQHGAEASTQGETEVLRRIAKLTWRELQTLRVGMSPEAIAIFERLFPQVHVLVDQILRAQSATNQPASKLGRV